MNKLYFRCNGGHYFTSTAGCPFDGWTCSGIEEAIGAFAEASSTGQPVSIERLRALGVGGEALDRILLVEFGSDPSAFQALAPEYYVHHGEILKAYEVGRELM